MSSLPKKRKPMERFNDKAEMLEYILKLESELAQIRASRYSGPYHTNVSPLINTSTLRNHPSEIASGSKGFDFK
jgi:hypothetical protein